MSTIKTETLSTPSNATVPVDTVVNGTAKAWVNFNGTGTVAIRRAFNVSSITDIAVGQYVVNFTTAMVNANYAITASAKHVANTGWDLTVTVGYPANSTNAVGVVSANNGATTDADFICVAIFS